VYSSAYYYALFRHHHVQFHEVVRDVKQREINYTARQPSTKVKKLCAETVQRAPRSLECVDDVEGGDGFPLCVFGVGDRVTDDVFKENLEDATGLLVDETRDTLHASTTGEATDSRLGDTLDVVAKNLAVSLGSTFSESLSAFAASRHV